MDVDGGDVVGDDVDGVGGVHPKTKQSPDS